jgi:cytoskeletal protein RodZ
VSIGATLAAARRHAGLTVGEVSDRTRVRDFIIEAIEQDDYAPCGGDFYARGHIRAIAGAVGTDPEPLIEEFDSRWRTAQELTAAEAFEPVMPIRTRERRRVRWTAALAVAVLAVIGFAAYEFASGVGHNHHTTAASGQRAGPGSPAAASASAPAVQASTALSSPRASPTQAGPTVTPSATPIAAQALTPVTVAAFGPGGTATGDDPARARLAIGHDAASPWYSDWYTTSDFGNLQAGTGLLLDMGRAVTVTSVRLSLGGAPGADLQLRAGYRPVLDSLHPVASRSGAGGTVQLQLASPVHARYLLIWFTSLPPDPSGTYQVSVYDIRIRGQI